MPKIHSDALIHVGLFSRTFIPGGFVFPAPSYTYLQDDTSVTYTRDQNRGSTGYHNIDPSLTLIGPDLAIDENSFATGTITELRFSSSNRGEIGRISDLNLDAETLMAPLAARLDGDSASNTAFDKVLAESIGTLTLTKRGEEFRETGFFRYLSEIDLGAGDDSYYLVRPATADQRHIDGGAGIDTLVLDDMGRPESFVVDLQNCIVQTDETNIFFDGFEIISGDPYVDRYLGSGAADNVRAAGLSDRIFGKGGNDTLSGGWGRDVIKGGRGDDLIDGGADRDRLFGGAGDDHFTWSAGRDKLNGGVGADIFEARPESGRDTIVNYRPDQGDRIEILSDGDFSFFERRSKYEDGVLTVFYEGNDSGNRGRLKVDFIGESLDWLTKEDVLASIDFI